MSKIGEQSNEQDPTGDPGQANLENQDQDPEGVVMDGGVETPTDDNGNPIEPDPGEGEGTTPAEGEGEGDGEGDKQAVNQEAVEKRIAKATWQRQEETRKREEAEKRAADAEAKLKELEAKEEPIVVPPMPDQLDDDYDQKVAARDEAIKKLGEAEARQQQANREQQEALANRAKTTADELKQLSDDMYDKAEKLGVKQTDLQQADNRVALYIKDQALGRYILSHDRGPLIVSYLASNPDALDSMGKMDPVTAAAFIASDVVPNTDAMMPKTTNTPAPATIPKGGGAGEKRSEYLDGVEFE